MNILASIRSMTINLGPDIPGIEVYTTEQLHSLVMDDDIRLCDVKDEREE